MTHQSGNYLVPQSSGPESKLKKIRCRHCGKNALENLVICPYCGRELHPAPPRVLVWGVPMALVLLFAMVVTSWGSSNPVTWAGQQWDRSRSLLTNMGQQIEPRLSTNEANDASAVGTSQQPLVAITSVENLDAEATAEPEIQASEPVSGAAQAEPIVQMTVDTSPAADMPVGDVVTETVIVEDTPTVAPTDTAVPAPTNTAPPTATSAPTATETPVVVVSEVRPTETATTVATATAENTPTKTPTRAVSIAQLRATQTPTPDLAARTSADVSDDSAGVVAASSASSVGAASASETATPIRTSTATRTASPTPSPTATATRAPTATPTPAVLTYEVQAGDTLLAIANRFDTTVDTLMAYNGLGEADVRALRTGQVLSIPGQVAVAQPGTDAAGLESYTVQAGDTPMAIANRFGVSVDALMTVNGLSQADATRLRTGQVLLIPSEESTSSASDATSAATATSAAAGGASATTVPAANEADYRVDAPRLRSPQDGTPVQCNRTGTLVWGAVPYIGLSDKYILHLGYVSGYDGGDAQVTWVLAQQRDSTRTSWDMDSDYCALAPQDLGRQWRWYVEVVNENGVPISPPSEIWSFTWN